MTTPDMEEIENVRMAAQRIAAIKAEIAELQAEDKRIKDWLDAEVLVDKQHNGVQKFEYGPITVKATVPQNISVDEVALDEIARTDPRAMPYLDQLFRMKTEVNKNCWNCLEPAAQQIFAPAITTKPGKTTYEFVIKED